MLKKPEMNALGTALLQFWKSSIGKKLIVAVTGILLVGFLVAHMVGNMLVYQGQEDLNKYAYFLHHFLHGWGIWLFRLGLIGAFALHIVATIALTRQNKEARNTRYAHEETVQAPRSSRIMIWSGLTVLGFVIFHILHFTIPVHPDLQGLKDPNDAKMVDVYTMVVRGFQNPLVVLFYIVAISLLCSHLMHGISSLFQTLGLRSEKTRLLIKRVGVGLALVLWLGFISIPVVVVMGALGDGSQEKPKPAMSAPASSSLDVTKS